MEILSSQWSILSIIFFIFIAIFLIRIRIRQNEKEKEYINQTSQHNVAPQSDGQLSENNKESKNQKKKIYILLVFAIAIFVAFLVGFVVNKDSSSNEGQNVSLLPIWVAVFVPLLASKQKIDKSNIDKEKEKRKFLILLILGFLMALGVILLYYSNQK